MSRTDVPASLPIKYGFLKHSTESLGRFQELKRSFSLLRAHGEEAGALLHQQTQRICSDASSRCLWQVPPNVPRTSKGLKDVRAHGFFQKINMSNKHIAVIYATFMSVIAVDDRINIRLCPRRKYLPLINATIGAVHLQD